MENIIDRWVLDSSFTAPLFLPDEQSNSIDGFFNAALGNKVQIFVPAVWWFEISNILYLSTKRQRLNYQQALNAIEVCKYFNFFQVEPVVFNQDIFALAKTYNLTAYDASYLDLAIRKQAGLASLDKQLNDVAKKLGIATWQ